MLLCRADGVLMTDPLAIVIPTPPGVNCLFRNVPSRGA